MKYCVEIVTAYVVEASDEDAAALAIFTATPEKLEEYRKAADDFQEITAVYEDEEGS